MDTSIKILFLLTTVQFGPAVYAIEWPQTITANEGEIIVYQPQPEKLNGNVLNGRTAFQIDLKDSNEPIFGAMWFSAKLDTNRDSAVASVYDIKVEQVTWPDSKDADEQRFTAVVENAAAGTVFELSMESLAATLETAELVQKSLENLNNEPPEIIFRQELAVLLLFDGEPKLSDIENSPYQRVLNAPFAVACDKQGKSCWLTSGKYWYQSQTALGPWAVSSKPPADLMENMPQAEDSEAQPDTAPAIVVATAPTELIVTVGAPEWTPLPGGEILYVSNTESPWLRYLPTGDMYLLLSGRWYRAATEQGPWTFVKADGLPAAFAKIPPASDIGGLRTSVAGTPEAEDAVRDQAIPQTAAIDRKSASLTVEYDGKPQFETIAGTQTAYAVNTGAQVLKINQQFYAVDNGVWFTSTSANGPWTVADSVPEDKIAEIPPTAPVYNTTHVHIYESTPEVVYVGYTAGYLSSYPYYGVPVYGTGWYYPPYYGNWYHPRPSTWGFHVGYNPWSGWSFGVSWSNGFFSFGASWGGGYGGAYRPWGCCGGWYGGGYRRPVIINTGNINIGNTINAGNRVNIGNKIGSSNRINAVNRSKNIYARPEVRNRTADRSTAQRNLKKARPDTSRMNNVYADRSGKVVRANKDKWQTREKGQWKDLADRSKLDSRDNIRPTSQNRPSALPARPSPSINRPNTRPVSRPSINTRELNRSAIARQRGQMHTRARRMHR